MENKESGSLDIKNMSMDQLIEDIDLSEEVKLVKKSKLEKLKYGSRILNSSFNEFMAKSPLLGYSIKRIIYAFITLYLATAVVFILLRVVTTDSVYLADVNLEKLGIKYGDDRYVALLNNRMKVFGVSGPLFQQVFIYLRNVTPFIPKTIVLNPIVNDAGEVVGNATRMWFYLGVFMNRASGGTPLTLVQDAFSRAMPKSFYVGGTAVLLSYIVGVPLGIIAARNKEKTSDSVINGTSLFIIAVPALVIISLFYKISIYVFGGSALWNDSSLYTKMWPVLAVMLLVMPAIIINTRRFVIDEMTSDYSKFAKSKGLSEKYVFYVHIFRNAGIRILKTIPELFVLTLFGSSILVERHWSIDGMSKYILDGVTNKDTFVVLGYIFVSASVGVFTSLIGDLLIAVLDPRIKLTK